MKYYKIICGTQFCGTEEETCYAFPDETTEKQIEEICEELCRENAEQYDYLATGWDDEMCEDENEREQILDDYYAEIWYHITNISKEEFKEWMRDNS